MHENLVIVESPAKAKTIERILGKEFLVTSSMGHIRDLEKKDFGIDIQNSFKPKYVISPDKRKIVADLKKLAKEAETVWLASDEDREGEAIAWHLQEVLQLDPEKTKRIVFHEITEEAIRKSIKNPRELDQNLVYAQQARRILDRIVGFEVSPVLWKKVKPALSAGRVQSVAVRLIVEREREIIDFIPVSSYRVGAVFVVKDAHGKTSELKAELSKRFKTKKEAASFLENCINAKFTVSSVVKKPGKRSPAPPFTTSTLQQEASRKLGFSVSQTMAVAQRLYEAGKITYMRTDSVNLSSLAIHTAKKKITEWLGEKYVKTRKFKTKSKSAQEAHEAIRPTYLNQEIIDGSSSEKKLYELIWKRTIASQMQDALLERTTVTIHVSTVTEQFQASGEMLLFDGFLKVYREDTDDENRNHSGPGQDLLPPIQTGDTLEVTEIEASEKYTQKPPRYTEASLVKRLEELGIGRPSTYAPTITTIQNRGYIVKEDRPGIQRKYTILTLRDKNITEQKKHEMTGAEKGKLFPTDIGMVVNDFLIKYFNRIMDYHFTAKVEKEFDDIAVGKQEWVAMIRNFYQPFHQKVQSTLENSERSKGERILGVDPESGDQVSVKIGRYGPIAQMGETANKDNKKPRFASLQPGQHLETITLEEALKLFQLPRELGDFENKKVIVGIGRFGPYVKHNNKFISLTKEDDPLTITLPRAVELIEMKREKERKAIIRSFEKEPELKIMQGRWGPYISYKKKNYKIPKSKNPEKLNLTDCMEIIEKTPETKKRKKK